MSGERPIGFSTLIALHQASAEDRAADPGAHSMWEYAQRHGAPRSGEEVFAVRFLIDAEAYQSPLTDPDSMGPLLDRLRCGLGGGH